ncbi:Histone-lysine N-methyltransferase SETMAR [Melipona quadrifasciata]|uniref:Histone-lysine N-methyltransferase SETMAR n=1 Tax=Melipona quadrifasciata TaxID=166423 RepID=A0A0N0BCE3_9HYME|nr:Histone-lysine N-methyltransferase SETMAR [Melipona quadrifasciata]
MSRKAESKTAFEETELASGIRFGTGAADRSSRPIIGPCCQMKGQAELLEVNLRRQDNIAFFLKAISEQNPRQSTRDIARRLNTSQLTVCRHQDKLGKFERSVLLHPPYFPGLAPTDYHLFCSLQNFLNGKIFNSHEQVSQAVENFFQSKPIDKLPGRWKRVIHNKLI